MLSALLFLPGGDRAGGLKEMEQTRSKGMLLRGEADYQLHLIYLWYERQPMTALRLIDGLRARYPHNPVFYLRLAEVQSDYNRNHAAALHTYRSLLRRGSRRTRRRTGDVGSQRAARHGAGDGCVVRYERTPSISCDAVIAWKPRGPVRRAGARVLSARSCARSRRTTIGSRRRVSTRARDHAERRSSAAARARAYCDSDGRPRRRRAADLVQNFSHFNHFFVDINLFSSIIYILYEGGRLRPPLVRPRVRLFS